MSDYKMDIIVRLPPALNCATQRKKEIGKLDKFASKEHLRSCDILKDSKACFSRTLQMRSLHIRITTNSVVHSFGTICQIDQ
jgi:hypothetical protein